MNRPQVFVSRLIPESGLSRLRETFEVSVWPNRLPPSKEELLQHVSGMDGILTLLSDHIDGNVMDQAGPNLKVISNFAVGYNNIDVEAASRRGILVGNTPDVLTEATADIAATLLLSAARRVKEASDQVRSGEWQTWEPTGLLGADLTGRTIGIVGMGRIGMATAKRFSAGWNMKVLYTSRSDKPEADQMGAKRVPLDQLLSESDFISVHVPLTDETNHLFGKAEFKQMKQNAVFINTSRGDIVDQAALVEALTTGQIASAGLDVTSPEPLPSDHPLVGLPNCLILPHIGSATDQARDDMASISVDNLIAGVSGQPLRAQVN